MNAIAETKRRALGLRARLILAAVILVLALALLFAVSLLGYKRAEAKYEDTIERLSAELDAAAEPVAVYEKADAELSLSTISSEIRAIGELATIEYAYTDAGKFSDPKTIRGFTIPLTTKSFIVKWDGSIKAGVDAAQIALAVDEEAKVVTVTLPAAAILSHEVDDESFETLDEKSNLFNPIQVDDVNNFVRMSKDAMERRAVDSGVLDKAQESARALITRFLNADPLIAEGYTIEFAILPAA